MHRVNTLVTSPESPSLADRRSSSFHIGVIFKVITSIFLFAIVLDGPLRYVLASKGLTPLIYAPKVLLLFALPILVVLRFRLSKGFFVSAVIITLSFLWGMANLGSSRQALFGLWVLVPLAYGALVARYIVSDIEGYRRIFTAALITAVVGVFLCLFTTFPWAGQSLDVGGVNVEMSRQWSAQGLDRYAGFSRASFNAASQLLGLAIWLVMTNYARPVKVVLWFVAGAGIVLTTTKGAIAAWLLLSIFFQTQRSLRGGGFWRKSWVFALSLVTCLVIALPITTLVNRYDEAFSTPMQLFLFASFGDRLSWMWPQSLGLMRDTGEWVLGRGIGGIGTAQQLFEPSKYLAGDNLFVYAAVEVGPVIAAALLIFLTWRVSKAFLSDRSKSIVFALFLFIMTYGLVVNILEEPFLAFLLGLVASYSFSASPRDADSSKPISAVAAS